MLTLSSCFASLFVIDIFCPDRRPLAPWPVRPRGRRQHSGTRVWAGLPLGDKLPGEKQDGNLRQTSGMLYVGGLAVALVFPESVSRLSSRAVHSSLRGLLHDFGPRRAAASTLLDKARFYSRQLDHLFRLSRLCDGAGVPAPATTVRRW